MKIKINDVVFFALLLVSLGVKLIFSQNDAFDCSQIKQKTAQSLSSAIGNSGVVVFSKDNLIKSGVLDDELKSWDTQIECYNSYALDLLKEQRGNVAYAQYIAELKVTNEYVKKTIKKLHRDYSSVYSRERGLVVKQLLRQSALKELPVVVKQLTERLEMVHSIAFTVIKNSIKATDVSEKWKRSIKADPNVILAKYKTTLKNYSTSKDFTSFKKKYPKLLEFPQVLMSKLEKLEYRLIQMSEKETKEKLKKELAGDAKVAQKLLLELRENYPLNLTEADIDKVAASTDKVSAIVLGQADAFSGILANLLKNVKELLAKAKQ